MPRNLVLQSLFHLFGWRFASFLIIVVSSIMSLNMPSMRTLSRRGTSFSSFTLGRRGTPNGSTTNNGHFADSVVVLIVRRVSCRTPAQVAIRPNHTYILTFDAAMSCQLFPLLFATLNLVIRIIQAVVPVWVDFILFRLCSLSFGRSSVLAMAIT